VVIAGSNGYVGNPTQRGFRIETNSSGTVIDGPELAVSSVESAAVALNLIEYKAQIDLPVQRRLFPHSDRAQLRDGRRCAQSECEVGFSLVSHCWSEEDG
jgi:hypothetical protein